jgi:hypothetical protein
MGDVRPVPLVKPTSLSQTRQLAQPVFIGGLLPLLKITVQRQ